MTLFNTLPKELNTLLLTGFQKCYVIYDCGHYEDYRVMGICMTLTDAIRILLESYNITSYHAETANRYIHNKYDKELNKWIYAIDITEDKKCFGNEYIIVEFNFGENYSYTGVERLWIQYRLIDNKIIKLYGTTISEPYRDRTIISYQRNYQKFINEGQSTYNILFCDDEFVLGPCAPLNSFDFSKYNNP